MLCHHVCPGVQVNALGNVSAEGCMYMHGGLAWVGGCQSYCVAYKIWLDVCWPGTTCTAAWALCATHLATCCLGTSHGHSPMITHDLHLCTVRHCSIHQYRSVHAMCRRSIWLSHGVLCIISVMCIYNGAIQCQSECALVFCLVSTCCCKHAVVVNMYTCNPVCTLLASKHTS